jgi:hypothetical protein
MVIRVLSVASGRYGVVGNQMTVVIFIKFYTVFEHTIYDVVVMGKRPLST